MRIEVIIVFFKEKSGHGTVGDRKDAVEMQTLFFGGTLTYADIFPAFAAMEMRKTIRKFFPKRFFRVQSVAVSKSYKIVESLYHACPVCYEEG